MNLCYQCCRTHPYHGATKTYVGGRVLCKDTRRCRQTAVERAEQRAEIHQWLKSSSSAGQYVVLARVRWRDTIRAAL